MPSPKKTKSTGDSQQAGKTPAAPVSKHIKEQEPPLSADEVISEIKERSKEADSQAEREIQEAIGKEARLKEPEVQIPPDVADAGIISPEKEASEALQKDTSVELPMTEEEYKKSEHTKISAKVTHEKEVFGVSSVVALTLFVGRMIKLAHHYARRIIFKNQKEGE